MLVCRENKEEVPVEHEEAISIQSEAPPPLVHQGGSHGKEGKDEEDEGLSFGDQVPVSTVRGMLHDELFVLSMPK